MNRKEYAVEVYNDDNGQNLSSFVHQVDVFQTYDEAKNYIDKNKDIPNCDLPEKGDYYGILCIIYDENDNEIDTERMEV